MARVNGSPASSRERWGRCLATIFRSPRRSLPAAARSITWARWRRTSGSSMHCPHVRTRRSVGALRVLATDWCCACAAHPSALDDHWSARSTGRAASGLRCQNGGSPRSRAATRRRPATREAARTPGGDVQPASPPRVAHGGAPGALLALLACLLPQLPERRDELLCSWPVRAMPFGTLIQKYTPIQAGGGR